MLADVALYAHIAWVQVAVVEGYAYTHLTQRLNLAGRHITEHLMELLLR